MLPFQSSVPAFQAVRTHNENIYINWMARDGVQRAVSRQDLASPILRWWDSQS